MKTYRVTVLEVRESSMKCESATAPGAFYLTRNPEHVQWPASVAAGDLVLVDVPDWLANRHRQLVGNAAFEAAKARR